MIFFVVVLLVEYNQTNLVKLSIRANV